jgi:hypothetical protein
MLVAVRRANVAHHYTLFGWKWNPWVAPIFGVPPAGPDAYYAITLKRL